MFQNVLQNDLQLMISNNLKQLTKLTKLTVNNNKISNNFNQKILILK